MTDDAACRWSEIPGACCMCDKKKVRLAGISGLLQYGKYYPSCPEIYDAENFACRDCTRSDALGHCQSICGKEWSTAAVSALIRECAR